MPVTNQINDPTYPNGQMPVPLYLRPGDERDWTITTANSGFDALARNPVTRVNFWRGYYGNNPWWPTRQNFGHTAWWRYNVEKPIRYQTNGDFPGRQGTIWVDRNNGNTQGAFVRDVKNFRNYVDETGFFIDTRYC